jgi:hypothetical protein
MLRYMARLGHGDDLPGDAPDHREQRDRLDPGARKEERRQPDRPRRRREDEQGSGEVGVGRLHLEIGRSRAAQEERSTVHKMYRATRRFSRPDNA